MKTKYIAAVAASVAALTTILLVPVFASSEVSYVRPPEAPIAKGTPEQEAWLAKLELCESNGNPKAINPNDLDQTPSFGLLQFKPSTFAMFSKAYGVKGELMDPSAQRAIVRRMMDDESVDFRRQFPGCVKRLGLPPPK